MLPLTGCGDDYLFPSTKKETFPPHLVVNKANEKKLSSNKICMYKCRVCGSFFF